MLINDENRRKLANYLADYFEVEMEIPAIDPPWTQEHIKDVMEQGLEAYESINQPKQYAIASGSLRINLNGQQFLLSDNKKVRLFDSIAEAKEGAESLGLICDVCEYLPESGDYVAVE